MQDRKATNLDELYNMMMEYHPSTLDWTRQQWSSDLPTFGGEAPSDTEAIWSWDDTRVIMGYGSQDLEIRGREAVAHPAQEARAITKGTLNGRQVKFFELWRLIGATWYFVKRQAAPVRVADKNLVKWAEELH